MKKFDKVETVSRVIDPAEFEYGNEKCPGASLKRRPHPKNAKLSIYLEVILAQRSRQNVLLAGHQKFKAFLSFICKHDQ